MSDKFMHVGDALELAISVLRDCDKYGALSHPQAEASEYKVAADTLEDYAVNVLYK